MRFRRRKSDEVDASAVDPLADLDLGSRSSGPWDISEVSLDEGDPSKIDLGGLIVTGRPGLELQLQVDQATGEVAAAVLAGEEGAVELRAFAAPRNGDIWADIRRSLAADVARHGGTADEADGHWGTELRVSMPVTLPDGRSASQPSRVVGIPGPRWLLRATLFGKPAVEPSPDDEVEAAVRDVIVVRGGNPLPPGDPIPMTMPANAEPIDPEA